MSDPFIAEILMAGFNFAPRGFALCDGQILPISQNQALFSLLGTTYGGDGRTTFGLPELRGRTPVHEGTGPGLPTKALGKLDGAETVALQPLDLPAHTHTPRAANTEATENSPLNNVLADPTAGVQAYKLNPSTRVGMNPAAVEVTGGGQAHTNVQPSLTISFFIALTGIFPARN